jgi:hypothetical protein
MILCSEIQAKETTLAPITKKDVSDALVDFYGKVIEPQFDRLNKRLDEHDKKLAHLLAHPLFKGSKIDFSSFLKSN